MITKELLLDLDRLSEHKALRHSERETIEGAANVLRKIQASQSTPAGEVTADAVEVACKAAYDSSDMGPFPDMAVNPKHEREYMQAALAAAFPILTKENEFLRARTGTQINGTEEIAALVQQVERLTKVAIAMKDVRDTVIREKMQLAKECETLSAENARLAKDAERYRYIRNVRDYSVICESPGDLYLRMPEQLDAAIDAATAQAKQG